MCGALIVPSHGNISSYIFVCMYCESLGLTIRHIAQRGNQQIPKGSNVGSLDWVEARSQKLQSSSRNGIESVNTMKKEFKGALVVFRSP
jgi:hypothetical protein